MYPDAIVFDLDGTLIDSIPDVANAVNRVLEKHGRHTLSIDDVRQTIGAGAGVMMDKAFRATGDALPDNELSETVNYYLQCYKETPAEKTIVYPAVRETLDWLFEKGISLGICTNKPFEMTTIVLQELDMKKYFTGITGGDNVPFCKPDGRHILQTLDLMDKEIANAIMVGDSATDINAARDAGIAVIGVSYGYGHESLVDSPPDILIDHMNKLIETFSTLSKQKGAIH